MRVRQVGDGAEVLWHAEFEPVDPMGATELGAMVDGYYKQTLENLKRIVEAANPGAGTNG